MARGEEVKGIYDSTDASAGVEIPFYDNGSDVARVLAANERLNITSIQVSAAVAGLTTVYLSSDATIVAKESVVRVSLPTNGTATQNFIGTPLTGGLGKKPFVKAAAGQCAVVFTGYITKH